MNVDEVLAKMDAPDANEEEIQYIIDENLRVISIPPLGVVLGVEGDKDVNVGRRLRGDCAGGNNIEPRCYGRL